MKMVCRKCRKDFEGSVLKPLLGASVGAAAGLIITPLLPPLIEPFPRKYPWIPIMFVYNRSAGCIIGAAYGWMAVESRMLCPACLKESQEVAT